MDLGPATVVLVEHIGTGHIDMRPDCGRSLVGSGADAVVVGARRWPRRLAGCAARLIGRDDLHDEPSVLVRRVGCCQEVRVLGIKGEVEVNVTVVFGVDRLDRTGNSHTALDDLEAVRVVHVR
jgi:hypothetical protein